MATTSKTIHRFVLAAFLVVGTPWIYNTSAFVPVTPKNYRIRSHNHLIERTFTTTKTITTTAAISTSQPTARNSFKKDLESNPSSEQQQQQKQQQQRRHFLSLCTKSIILSTTATTTATTATPFVAHAEENNLNESQSPLFERIQKDFSYEIRLPPNFQSTNKPLKTHLDEINFTLEGTRGYQYGITVDPIRIRSLRDFGTPEEVAAKIVMAEVNRDGVFEVKLANDPTEDPTTGAYNIDYVSDGKRGKKHFVTRTLVKDGKLFVLTAQCKEEEYYSVDGGGDREMEIGSCVDSFRVR